MVFGGTILAGLFGFGKSEAEELIRPPGALDEDVFLATCSRCGKCAEICTAGCIKIARGDKGVAIGTPYIEPVEESCVLCLKCTEVCPTGALKKIARSEVKMGLASIDYDICLARKDEDCRVCHANCPEYNKAIYLEDNKYPAINPDYCTGCGNCEKVCVAAPRKAATVQPIKRPLE